MHRKTDDTLDLDLNWHSLDNDDANGLDIEEDTLHISDEMLVLRTPNRMVRWLSAHPRLWLVTCTIIPLLLGLVGVTYRVEVDLGLASFQVRDHITYRALESYIAAVKLHRALILNMANTHFGDSHSPPRDIRDELVRDTRSVNGGQYEKMWTFHIIFSLNEQSTKVNATIFTPGHVLYMHRVVQQLTAMPEYTAHCWLRGDRCQPPGSLLAELMDGDVLRADWSVRLTALREKGVYWYTDQHFPETGSSLLTRVELYFGGPLPGYESKIDRPAEQSDKLLRVLVPLRNALRHVTSDPPGPVDVHWGGDAITGYEVRETVFGDAQFALGSLFLVAVLVFVQLRSPFLAMYAMYELLIAFPAVYGVYMYACQLETVNLLTGVALFLVIGIGVDDVFVFYFSYQRARALYPDAHALQLAHTYGHAMLATFVTSLTTAAAFLANLFSQIPALRMFGIYMSLIVMMNWLLSVTLFPAALVTWDRHVRATERKIVACLVPCLIRKKPAKPSTFNKKLGRCLSNHVYTLRYPYLAIFAVLTAVAVYQSLSLEGASTPPQVFQHNSNLGWFSEWQRSGWVPDPSAWTAPKAPPNNATHGTPHAPTPVTWTPVTRTPVTRTPSSATPAHSAAPTTTTTPSTVPAESETEPPIPPSKNNIDVHIVWGLTGYVNGSHVNPRDPFSEWIGVPELDTQFDPLTAPCIDHLATVCDTLWARGLLASEGRCLLSAFKQRMMVAGTWPLSDRNAVLYHLLLFIRNNIEEYQSDFSLNHFNWTDIKTRILHQQPLDLQVTWLRYSFHSTTGRSVSSREAVQLYHEWQRVLDELDLNAPRECRGGLQFSDTWIEALTETTLVDNIFTSLVTSLVVALGTLLLFVGNVITAFLALVTLAANLFLTLGAFKLLGWTLGAVESLCMTLLVGLSVDYVLHLAHAYTVAARRAPLQPRQVLLSEAIQSMGTAILSGAITTVASTSMLLLCQIVIFIKFGAIICMTLVTALLLTTLLFPTLVLVFGPRNGDSCDLYVMSRTLTRVSCGRSALQQNDFALLRDDECHVLVDHMDATD